MKLIHVGFIANILTVHVSELFDSVAQHFFSKIQSPDHCLHSVLPEEKTSRLALRPRGHQRAVRQRSDYEWLVAATLLDAYLR